MSKFNLNTPITDNSILERINKFLYNSSFKIQGDTLDNKEIYSVLFNKVFLNNSNILCISFKIKKDYVNSYIYFLFNSFIKGIINNVAVPAKILGEKEEVKIELMNKARNKINYIIKAYQDYEINSYEDLISKAEELSISKLITFEEPENFNKKDYILSEDNLTWLNDNVGEVIIKLGYNTTGDDNVDKVERALLKDFPDLELETIPRYNNLATDSGKAIKAVQMYIHIPAKIMQEAPKAIKQVCKNNMIVNTSLVWTICKKAQKYELDNLYPGFKRPRN